MQHNSITRSLLFASLITLTCGSHAQAQLASSPLPLLPGQTAGYATGISHGQIAGGTTVTTGHAVLWNGTTNAAVDLDPGKYGSTLTGIDGGTQVGSYGAYRVYVSGGGSGRGGGYHPPHWVNYYHAALWKGSNKSLVDLASTPASNSNATAVSGSKVVGYLGSTTDTQACLWTGTAASLFVLNPPTCPDSKALAVGAVHEGGYIYSTNGYDHAALWTGAGNTPVDLHPTDLTTSSSFITCLDDTRNQQGGYLRGVDPTGTTLVNTAYLWTGTPTGVVLAPAGSTSSQVVAMRGGYQVGVAAIGGVTHAIRWKGTAASALDLGPGQATAIDLNGDIVGTSTASGAAVPTIWRVTTTAHLTVTQTPLPNAAGWINSPVQMAVQSPYTTGTPTISYYWGSAAPTTVAGSSTTLSQSAQGTRRLTVSASDGTHTTMTQFCTVNIDTVAPSTKLTNAGDLLTLTATDASSGVVATYYTLDGSAATLYSVPFAVSNTAHTVTFWSVDGGGNIETAHSVAIAAVPPTISSITLPAALASATDTSITVAGTGFLANTVVLWNGTPIATTFVDTATLTAVIPGSDLTTPTTAQIVVQNSAPGAGTSAAVSFPVYQEAVATGIADDGGLAATVVSSHSGFTFSGETLNIVATSTTVYEDSSGGTATAYVFDSAIGTGAAFTATGTYSNGTLTAWTLKLN